VAGFWREYSPAVGFSVLLHGGIVVAVVILTQLHFSHAPQTIHPLAIDAVVIDARTLHAREPAAAAAPAPAPAAEQPPAPVATPAPVPAKPAVERAAEAKARAAEAAAAATLARQRIADSQAEAARVAATLAAQKAAESAKKAAEAQRAAEAQKAQEAQKALDAQKAADAKKAAELRAKADREAELRRQLADEEHVHEVESGPAAASYYAQLQARMTRAWNKPPSAGPGTDCRVEVTQAPGGDVLGVRVMQCNGDAAVRQSIENAVYHASPLPAPPDPALFHRVFIFEFKPDE
jgi:colicin import membrane protein